jgi:hypothetical protein
MNLVCAGCQRPLLQETQKLEKPFIKLSGTHLDPSIYPSTCPINTTWVMIWKDQIFWENYKEYESR